ncbi:hypothetical protein Nepgr_022526 [Nepenthes gracilis]|uniref:non-specific serine/threonine protein kinase n=1 Tax=Nepenthes gracilis TaxID=150966 RepID=A0AAD3XY98_NEPGR|nr:hypothetical protein Nepgr_022526 [Nepenthes gracilis]
MTSTPSSSPEAPPPSTTSPPPNSSAPPPQSSPPPASSTPTPPPSLPPTATPPPPRSSPPPTSAPPPPTGSPPPTSSPPPPTSSPSPTSSPPPPTASPPLPSPSLAPPPSPPLSPSPSPPLSSPPLAPPPLSPATSVSSPPTTSGGSPAPSPPPPIAVAPAPPPSATFPSPPPANSQSPPQAAAPQNSAPPPAHLTTAPSSPKSSAPSVPSESTPSPLNSTPPATEVPNSAPLPPGSAAKPPVNSSARMTDLTGRSTVPISDSPNGGSNAGIKYGAAIGVLAAVVVIGLIMTIAFLKRKRRKVGDNPYMLRSPYASSQDSGSSFLKYQASPKIYGNHSGSDFAYSASDPGGLGNSRPWFTYEELSDATNGFSSKSILGAGGFGCVYKGFLTDGREVAVKKLKAGSGQGDREFRAEVEIISRVHHRHLVSLVGYCINDCERLLVYEFVPNNTLYHHLHAAGRPVMDWALRVKVAAGSARGIAYIHEDCHPRIIHRDIKSANILLENNFEAKVADFGLAKLAEELDVNTHVSTRVMGTFGYMAPEYASSGKLTEKSDIFSFGVVLLELITGRKPVDESQPLGDESLVEWARPLLTQALETEEFEEVADPRLGGNYVPSQMFRMVEAAAACVRHSASKRPRMTQVVRALDSICEPSSDLSNGVKPGQSEIFNSREQSAQIRMFQRTAFGSQDDSSGYFNDSPSSRRGGH